MDSPEGDVALADAERKGFRLAVMGRTVALVCVGLFYLVAFPYPNNLRIAPLILAIALLGLVPLALIGRRSERAGRYAFFAFDAALISAMVALGPLSAGADIPQNFVFLSGRTGYYFVLVALSILTLSPALVLWTGLCAIFGLAAATGWIVAGMDRVVGFGSLPPSPSREAFLAVVFNPDFLSIGVRVNEGILIAVSTGVAALAVHRARGVLRAHAAVEARRSRAERMFGRYVPTQVAERLLEGGRLAPELREASVLFADIEGFTGLAEGLPPARVIGLLDDFFAAATAAIDREGGVIVNHVGDGLIAAFNAPLPAEDHAARAVRAAHALLVLVASREFGGHRLKIRIGIATGPVAAGTVGGSQRQSYTLYGDTVNLAQRLERLNKKLHTNCLVSDKTYGAAPEACAGARSVGSVQVRGREGSLEVFATHPAAGQPGPAVRPR